MNILDPLIGIPLLQQIWFFIFWGAVIGIASLDFNRNKTTDYSDKTKKELDEYEKEAEMIEFEKKIEEHKKV